MEEVSTCYLNTGRMVVGYSSFLLKRTFKEYILFLSARSLRSVESIVTVVVGISRGMFLTGVGLI